MKQGPRANSKISKSAIGNRKSKMSRKGSLTGKSVVPKNYRAFVACRFDSCPFLQDFFLTETILEASPNGMAAVC